MNDLNYVLTLLFLMLGPFKILGPFALITNGQDAKFMRQLAIRATVFSIVALLVAAFIGKSILNKFGIPLSILSLSAGIIFFLVALLNILEQFRSGDKKNTQSDPPTLRMAMSPLAFPVIVTPYGIAALIIFIAISPDVNTKITIVGFVIGIMLINLVFMLVSRHAMKVFMIVLPILGAVLGVIQVALGLQIIYKSILELMPV